MWKTVENFVRVVFTFCTIREVCGLSDEIYGASVHWRPNGSNSVVLSYRLVWNRRLCGTTTTSEGTCNKLYLTGNTPVVRFNNYLKEFKWQFETGNVSGTTDLSDLYFTDIGVLHEVAYETGVGMTEHTFGTQKDTANIILSFLDSKGIPFEGLGEGHLSMAIRNDTNRANISPLLNVFPVNRVPLGCNSVIRLFPFDGDGDYVKCHWVKFPIMKEKEMNAVLNEDTCELTVDADAKTFQAGDKLHISLYAEDYSRFPIKFTGVSNDISTGPFSSTPLKLMVYIGTATNNPGGCGTGPEFTRQGTLKPYYKHSYTLPFKEALVKLPFETYNTNGRIQTTGPRYMIFDERKNMTLIEEGVWNNLTDPTMKGIHQACGAVYTADGIPGESRCAVLMVNDLDDCNPNPCTRAPGGICDNLFDYYTCTYPDDPTYDGNKWTGPCEPEKIVEKADDNMGVKVGLPVGLSLLLLLIVVGVTMYLKRYWTEKLKNSVVEPETAANGMANGVTEKVGDVAFL